MLFNSIDFAIFLPIVFVLYWFVLAGKTKAQNVLIAVASYFFYGYWDWRFLTLIAFSTVVDYYVGIQLGKREGPERKLFLILSLVVNLGLLGFFKYFNFFIGSFNDAFTLFGREAGVRPLSIILPVGISFYTFQTLSYSIDLYRRKIEPAREFITFAAYVSFFPQLVAGPIERAGNLLPQFYRPRIFTYERGVDGMRQILFGLFKKVVIADNAALIVNDIFNNHENYGASTLVLGAVLFAFQIYGDFSGYSDIAIGTARLFGFDLMKNFNYPYFSRNIAEFWRRWHISLSTWFRDYLYFPLGGSRGSLATTIRNVFIIFVVSGFWHGAKWTFVIWGFLHAIYYLPSLLTKKNRLYTGPIAEGRILPGVRESFDILLTFFLVVFAWIFFRAESIQDAFGYIGGLFDPSIVSIPQFNTFKLLNILFLPTIVLMLMVEWISRAYNHPLEHLDSRIRQRAVRWAIYISLLFLITIFAGDEQAFIYFQF